MIPLGIELVRAGPGTGKTYQLAHRFAGLVIDAGHDPSRIAAVTFTRAAAAELRERVRDALDERGATPEMQARVDDSPMLTIDAFSNWVLRMSTDHRFTSTTPVSALLESGSRSRRAQQWLLENARDAISDALTAGVPMADPGFGHPYLDYVIERVVGHPARTRSNDWLRTVTEGDARWPGLTPNTFTDIVDAVGRFAEHEALGRLESGDTSYEDTTALAIEFVQSAEGSATIRRDLSALLVDELQDTDPLQEQLLNAIWSLRDESDHPAIDRFLVGDLKQAIYQFRNADPRVMERFIKTTPPDRQANLTINRRSPAIVIDALNAVAHQWFDDEPELEPLDAERDGAFVVLGRTPMADPDDPSKPANLNRHLRPAEANAIASLLAQERPAWEQGTCALLIPTRTALNTIEAALLDAGLPVLNLASAPHDSDEIQEARVLLTAIANPSDTVAVIGALRGPALAIPDADLDAAMTTEGPNHRQKLLNQPATRDAMEQLETLRAQTLELPVGAIVEQVLDNTGLWDLCEGSSTWANRLHWLATQANEFDRRGGGSLGRFLLHLRALAEGERNLTEQLVPPPGQPVIQLMTMHTAKGLQFDTVIVAGLHKGGTWSAPLCRWEHDPTADAWTMRVNLGIDDPAEFSSQIEQTKRLLYVALSRAKTNLVVSAYYPNNPRNTRQDDPCAMLRGSIKECATSEHLVAVEPSNEPTQVADRVSSPVAAPRTPLARTVTEIATSSTTHETTGAGRGADHGTKVHAAIAAVVHFYGQTPTSNLEELLAELQIYRLADNVKTDVEQILRLPTLANAIEEGRSIQAEYPVAGTIDGEPVYGVVDLIIELGGESVCIADVKTDHHGEQDPARTPYEKQLEIYAALTGASHSILLGPDRQLQ